MLEPKSDPKEMMEGMEEFLFRSGTMNFGKKKDPKDKKKENNKVVNKK